MKSYFFARKKKPTLNIKSQSRTIDKESKIDFTFTEDNGRCMALFMHKSRVSAPGNKILFQDCLKVNRFWGAGQASQGQGIVKASWLSEGMGRDRATKEELKPLGLGSLIMKSLCSNGVWEIATGQGRSHSYMNSWETREGCGVTCAFDENKR